jgi:hypothetical protein
MKNDKTKILGSSVGIETKKDFIWNQFQRMAIQFFRTDGLKMIRILIINE